MAKGIHTELKQTKPFPNLQEEAFAALLRTADYAETQVAGVLKPSELSPTQYNALRILRGAGTAGLACNEIGARMLTHDPDITRLVMRLEKRGLVQRKRDLKDRRVITTSISSAGLEILRRLDGPVTEFNRQFLGSLGEQRLQSLIRILQAIREKSGGGV